MMEIEKEVRMRALTVIPGQAGSARLADVPEPPIADGSILVQSVAMGVCGTDIEIASGHYGWPAAGSNRLILGHESLGHVLEAPAGAGVAAGDLVVGIVRRPDPVPCPYCAVGEWDMCSNGRYTERGIKERDGYGSERFRLEPEFTIKLDPSLSWLGVLLEPTSVVAKAWDEIDRIGHRAAAWNPRTVLVTGAGPIGLLAALIARQRGLEVHVLDRVTTGRKPALVHDLGAIYHARRDEIPDDLAFDVIVECTGATSVLADLLSRGVRSGIICLAGVSPEGEPLVLDLGRVNRRLVLGNGVVFGTVNGNRSHYASAADVLQRADRNWLTRLISRRVPLDHWREALHRQPDDVKVILDFQL
jgi:threonine dehydrogenase-like Zn-dependent dehydrogenase